MKLYSVPVFSVSFQSTQYIACFLQDGSCSFVGGLTVTLNTALSSDDWAAIQANIYLATTFESTYISMQAGFLTDGSNIPISSSAALQV